MYNASFMLATNISLPAAARKSSLNWQSWLLWEERILRNDLDSSSESHAYNTGFLMGEIPVFLTFLQFKHINIYILINEKNVPNLVVLIKTFLYPAKWLSDGDFAIAFSEILFT